MQRAPYRLRYLHHTPTAAATTYTFDIDLQQTVIDEFDGYEVANCDRMTLDYAQIQICECVCVCVWWGGEGTCV